LHKTILYILLLFFSLTANFSFASNESVLFEASIQNSTVIYKNNFLFIQGLIGKGKVEVYSIIGNKVSEHIVVDLSNAKVPVYLETGNMYIVRVYYQENIIKTFKIFAS